MTEAAVDNACILDGGTEEVGLVNPCSMDISSIAYNVNSGSVDSLSSLRISRSIPTWRLSLRLKMRCLQSVRVVFAVPISEENKVESKQPIRWNPFANFENVDFIPDVGPVETNQLKAANVRTVRGLRRAGDAPSTQQRTFFSPEVLTRYTAILKSFDERQKSIESMLTKIPQYVWKT
ncbi:hypothetical protein PC117_g14164 [Phytophthora cactorum]|uniref:Uncharacterized protein n=1 Tax=Phytophthora cactorum TaxID=29920 RepID=A0A8T1CVW4_9STRA|nr:hypothetical protein PC117_g14164 [Phytophthora cactorum]